MNNSLTYTNSFIIKNGEIFDVIGDLCKILSSNSAKIDDWDVSITKKGLVCTCIEELDGDIATLKYTIFNKGFSRLVLKLPNEKTKVIKKEWLSKPNRFKLDGIVTLSNGPLTKRKCCFKCLKGN